jgi:O-antigen/teichoic acid export membrane protein
MPWGLKVYGTYFAVFNFSFSFHILLDFGINQFNNREVSQRAGFAGEHLVSIVALKVLLSLAYLGITFLLALMSGFSAYQLHLLELLALNLILLNFILYLRSSISARQHFILDGLLSVSDRSPAILFCADLLFSDKYADRITIDYFIYAESSGALYHLCVCGHRSAQLAL